MDSVNHNVWQILKKNFSGCPKQAGKSSLTNAPNADNSAAFGLWSKFDARMKLFLSKATQRIVERHMELSLYKEVHPVFLHEMRKTHSHILPQMAKLIRMHLSHSCRVSLLKSRGASLSKRVKYWYIRMLSLGKNLSK